MAVKAANRIGRRAPLSLRTTDDLRAKLEASASESVRNLTLEIERRLELSYEWERKWKDAQAMLAEHKAKIEQLEGGGISNTTAALRRLGWRDLSGTKYGT